MGEVIETHLLAHFGVKGMHWGVRRNKVSGISSEDDKRVRDIRQKVRNGGAKALSNEEMQTLINRMNLEQQYKRLNPSKIQTGAKVVSGVLRVGTTVNQAIAFANSPAGKAIAAAIKRGR